MGFIEEMKELLIYEKIYSLDELIKLYGPNINNNYQYFINFDDSINDIDNYNIHYEYNYWGSSKYNEILNKYSYSMEWLGGDAVGIQSKTI